MKKIVMFFLFFSVSYSQTYVGGTISSSETWTKAGSPYILSTDITVKGNGVKLRIENDVVVDCRSGLDIRAYDSSKVSCNGVEFLISINDGRTIIYSNNYGEVELRNCTFNNVSIDLRSGHNIISNIKGIKNIFASKDTYIDIDDSEFFTLGIYEGTVNDCKIGGKINISSNSSEIKITGNDFLHEDIYLREPFSLPFPLEGKLPTIRNNTYTNYTHFAFGSDSLFESGTLPDQIDGLKPRMYSGDCNIENAKLEIKDSTSFQFYEGGRFIVGNNAELSASNVEFSVYQDHKELIFKTIENGKLSIEDSYFGNNDIELSGTGLHKIKNCTGIYNIYTRENEETLLIEGCEISYVHLGKNIKMVGNTILGYITISDISVEIVNNTFTSSVWNDNRSLGFNFPPLIGQIPNISDNEFLSTSQYSFSGTFTKSGTLPRIIDGLNPRIAGIIEGCDLIIEDSAKIELRSSLTIEKNSTLSGNNLILYSPFYHNPDILITENSGRIDLHNSEIQDPITLRGNNTSTLQNCDLYSAVLNEDVNLIINKSEIQNTIRLFDNSHLSVDSSNFLIDTNKIAIDNNSSNTVNAESNYWNGDLGPQHDSNIDGNGCKVNGNVDCIPFLETPTLRNNDAYIRIKVIQKSYNPRASYVGLWTKRPGGLLTVRDTLLVSIIDGQGYAIFTKSQLSSFAEFHKFTDNLYDQKIFDLYLFEECSKDNEVIVGKIPFKYSMADYDNNRIKEAIVILHNDLVSYQNHPIEGNNIEWKFKNYYKYDFKKTFDEGINYRANISSEIFQTTMLIPPSDEKCNFLLSNIRESRKPLLFIHGVSGIDQYWDYSGGKDEYIKQVNYPFTSYTGRLRNKVEIHNNFDIWEYYYPSDQAWDESAFLLGRDIKEIYKYYDYKKVNIVAHSMGGLVTRGYIQKTSVNYKTNPNYSYSNYYSDDIEKILFLATPQNGSFGGTRYYWSIYVPNGLVEPFSGKDPFAPAYRKLQIGDAAFKKLNHNTTLNNSIKYLQTSGTSYIGLTPDIPFSDTPLINESKKHEDGIVSICSGNLLPKGIDLILVKDFCHSHFQSPLNHLRELSEEEKNVVPNIIANFFLDIPISSNEMLKYFDADGLITENTIPEWGNAENLRLDITLPIVEFLKENNKPWVPEDTNGDGVRFKLSTDVISGEKSAILVKEEFNSSSDYEDRSLYLYYSENNFDGSTYKTNLKILPKYSISPFFYGFESNKKYSYTNSYGNLEIYTDDNPLAFTENVYDEIESDNLGWHSPSFPSLTLDVYLGYQVNEKWFGKDPWYIYKIPDQKLNLQWSKTTYHTFPISKAAEGILNNNQYVAGSISWEGPLNLNKVMSSDSLLAYLDNQINNVSFLLNYGNNPEPTFKLLSPSGTEIGPQDADDETILYSSNPSLGTSYYTLFNPESGKWKIKINDDYFLPDTSYKIVYPMSVNNWLTFTADTNKIGHKENVLLTAQLSNSEITVNNLNLETYYYSNNNESINISLNDDGINGDLISGDNIFSGYFKGDEFGVHKITALMRGEMESTTFVRQASTTILTLLPAPVLTGPENILNLDTSQVKFTWSSDSSLSLFEVHVSSDSMFSFLSHFVGELSADSIMLSDFEPNKKYYWRVRGFGILGESNWSSISSFGTAITNLSEKNKLPRKFTLYQNYPNPFNATTTIKYDLPKYSNVKLELFDVLGRKIKTLVNTKQQPGTYKIQLNLNNIASGVYFYRVQAGSDISVHKMVLIK